MCIYIYIWLVVWNIVFMTFHSVGNVIIPTVEVHHFSRWLLHHQPDTYIYIYINIYTYKSTMIGEYYMTI